MVRAALKVNPVTNAAPITGTAIAVVGLLENNGPKLPFPYSSGIQPSKHSYLRELRIQYKGEPYRIFYAFDLRRVAILLLGGNKEGIIAGMQKASQPTNLTMTISRN